MGKLKEHFTEELEARVEALAQVFAKTPLCDVQKRIREMVEMFAANELQLKVLKEQVKELEMRIEEITPKEYNA